MSEMVETDLGPFPKSWPLQPVGEVFETQLGKMLSKKARAGTNPKPYRRHKNVQWGYIDVSDLLEMDFDEREQGKFSLIPGDLLVCEGGDGGRCGMVYHGSLPDPCIIQNALHRVRPRLSGSVGHGSRNDYLQYLMSMVASTGWFDVLTDKATIAHFTAEKFGALPMPIPPSPEQAAIVRFLDHADRRIRRYIRAQERRIAVLEDGWGDLVALLYAAE